MTIQFDISEHLYKCLKKRIELNVASELDMLVDKGTVIEQEPKMEGAMGDIPIQPIVPEMPKTDGDCISRKAVLKLFAIGGEYDLYTDRFITHDGKYLYEVIRDMPSVQSKMGHCEDCVSRQAVIDAINNNRFRYTVAKEDACTGNVLWDSDLIDSNVAQDILNLSFVNLQVKTGHWEDCSNGWMCSECERDNSEDTKYCPNCGAKMESEGEE